MHDDDGSDDMGYLEGVFSELKTWDKALTQNEIENIEDQDEFLSSDFQFSLNENNILYDTSTNANHGTIYGATWVENIEGCTDELAGNYNDEANMDDGSCTNYPDNGEYSLSFDGNEIDLPIITGTENEHAIDISKIRSETGLITLDKGYKNTGSTTSKITFLDGEKVTSNSSSGIVESWNTKLGLLKVSSGDNFVVDKQSK